MILDLTDTFITKLWDKSPFIAIMLLAIVATIIIVRKIDKFLYKQIDPLEQTINNHSEILKKFEEHSDCLAHKESIKIIDNKLNAIIIILASKFPDTAPQLTITHSPRQLTDIGRKLYKDSGASKMLEENIDYFIESLNKLDIKTAFDVETQSLSLLLTSSDMPIFVDIKNWVYNNSEFEGINITFSEVCFVSSIELRNEYLKRNPEIEQNRFK